MSALGHKRTFRSAISMSALPPKADILRDVVFQMAEVAIPHELFADFLRRIDRLRPKLALA